MEIIVLATLLQLAIQSWAFARRAVAPSTTDALARGNMRVMATGMSTNLFTILATEHARRVVQPSRRCTRGARRFTLDVGRCGRVKVETCL
jgi:hypothetical protein